MPAIQYGLSSYKRSRGDLAELPVINMFAEESDSEGGVILQSRPGLVDRGADIGGAPIEALFKRDMVLGSDLFGVAKRCLYRNTALVGEINGSDPVSMAGYENFLFVAAGSSLWGYDGSDLLAIDFPDGASVAKVLIAGSRVVALRKDTGKFYWSDALGTSIDALAFATAEDQPDRLLDADYIDGILVLYGAETVEFWPHTTDADLPFQPLQGRIIEKGIKATGCASSIASTFAWVTNENTICLGDENTVISNPGLEERIENSGSCRLFKFTLGGYEFLALRLDDETQVWNWRTRLWSQFASHGVGNWIPQCFAGDVFGSSIDGRTMTWGTGHTDLGSELERRVRGGFPINSGGAQINKVQLRRSTGQAPFVLGEFAEPALEMRVSRDVGRTWSTWKPRSLGRQGAFNKHVRWNAQGMASQPGFLAEWRVTAPIDWRVSGAFVNEQWGGR